MADGLLPVNGAARSTATCCCGCSLASATVFAVVICKIQCIVGLFLNIMICYLYNNSDTFVEYYIDFSVLPDSEVIYGLTIGSIVLLSVWLLLVTLVYRGNTSLNRALLTPWFLFTILITQFDVGTTVYLSVRFQAAFIDSDIFWLNGKPTPTCSYLTLMVIFSRGVIVWFLNLYFAHVVNRRGREIERNNSALALYILSHLSPCRQENGERCRHSQSNANKPTCHPSYLPNYLMECNQENLESSWSLNADVLQGISSFVNPLYPRIDQNSVSDYSDVRHPVSPYGTVPTYEQSLRYQSNCGVLPS